MSYFIRDIDESDFLYLAPEVLFYLRQRAQSQASGALHSQGDGYFEFADVYALAVVML